MSREVAGVRTSPIRLTSLSWRGIARVFATNTQRDFIVPGAEVEGLSTRQPTLELQRRSQAGVVHGPSFASELDEDGLAFGFTLPIALRGFVHRSSMRPVALHVSHLPVTDLTLGDRGSRGLGGYLGESMATRGSHYGR